MYQVSRAGKEGSVLNLAGASLTGSRVQVSPLNGIPQRVQSLWTACQQPRLQVIQLAKPDQSTQEKHPPPAPTSSETAFPSYRFRSCLFPVRNLLCTCYIFTCDFKIIFGINILLAVGSVSNRHWCYSDPKQVENRNTDPDPDQKRIWMWIGSGI